MANTNRYKSFIVELCQTGHWTAEQIQTEIRSTFPWSLIGLGTVYRNLTELVTEEVLMKQHGLGDKMIYEKLKPRHGHIFCQHSSQIFDVDVSKLNFADVEIPEEFCSLEVQVTFAGHFNGSDPRYCSVTGKKLR